MIAAQTSLDARRLLRDQGGNAIAIVLEQADGSALHASVGPPRFAYQAVENAQLSDHAGRVGRRCLCQKADHD